MSKPKAKGEDWISLGEARQRLGVSQMFELLHLVLEHQILPRRRPGYSFWYLTGDQVNQLRRLARLPTAGSTRP
jgi:hypothetical protein